jgi:hypothetical protein
MPSSALALGTASARDSGHVRWPISTERMEITDATSTSSAAAPTAPIVTTPDGLTTLAATWGYVPAMRVTTQRAPRRSGYSCSGNGGPAGSSEAVPGGGVDSIGDFTWWGVRVGGTATGVRAMATCWSEPPRLKTVAAPAHTAARASVALTRRRRARKRPMFGR